MFTYLQPRIYWIFVLVAYVLEAALRCTLPTADENAVTVCNDPSVFQLVPVSNSSYEKRAFVLLSLELISNNSKSGCLINLKK